MKVGQPYSGFIIFIAFDLCTTFLIVEVIFTRHSLGFYYCSHYTRRARTKIALDTRKKCRISSINSSPARLLHNVALSIRFAPPSGRSDNHIM